MRKSIRISCESNLMRVSSEVQRGLLQTIQHSSFPTLTLQIPSPNKSDDGLRSSLSYEDPDGDLIVPRKKSNVRRKRPNRNALVTTTNLMHLRVAASSDVDECGTQLWRGALLLSELLLDNNVMLPHVMLLFLNINSLANSRNLSRMFPYWK